MASIERFALENSLDVYMVLQRGVLSNSALCLLLGLDGLDMFILSLRVSWSQQGSSVTEPQTNSGESRDRFQEKTGWQFCASLRRALGPGPCLSLQARRGDLLG